MAGYIVVLHPARGREPRVEFIGANPRDFYDDGYSYWMEIPVVPADQPNKPR